MKKITIIDGNSLLFRSYYATAFPGAPILRNQDGIPTNAVFAFSNMINKIISGIKEGEGLFVAFDAGKHTFRNDALETYKANRKPAPEELVQQFPMAREFLKCMGIFTYELVGFEGDDIAGTIATMAKDNGCEVHIYTSDRDFLQLVDPQVSVHILKKGLSDVMIMTPDAVKETYGFEPKQIIDYKGLRGDSADNLPGIPGIGDITAVKLIQEYGSFDEIVNKADEIKGKIGQSIKDNQQQGRLCRDLAIIKTDVPLDFTVESTVYEGYEFSVISAFCQKYGLKQFINKICPKWKKRSLNDEIEVVQIQNSIGIDFPKEFGLAVDYSNDNYTMCDVLGYAISFDEKTYYITKSNLLNDAKLLAILNDASYKKNCFDFKKIKVSSYFNNVDVNGLNFDMLIASYLLDASIKSDPESVLHMYGVDLKAQSDEIGLFSFENPQKTGKLAYFCNYLKETILQSIEKVNETELLNKIELPLVDTLSDMEIEGFPLDAKILKTIGEEYKSKCDELAEEIYSLAGEKFNISSPKQIGEILFEKLGISNPNKKISTSVDVLKLISDKHPIVNKILNYRKYFKIVSTYTDSLVNHIQSDGKIHAKFNQALTQTGRLSSSEPNLQNISIRDEDGKIIRKAFHYSDPNYEILSLDYSQIELRILASMSNCQKLINVFNQNLDIHAETAKTIFNLSTEPNKSQRRLAKTVNFGIVYGISDFGLSDELEVSIPEARRFIDTFYSSYPEIKEYLNSQIKKAETEGFVSTLFGRRRYLPEIHDANYQIREFAKRAAMNAPIQGTAADLIKLAMVKIHNELKNNNLKSKLVSQIHDELILKVEKSEKDQVFELVKRNMENVINLQVKFEVDGGFGKDWYDAK